MTTPILFLLGAIALSALGGLVVWIASRPRPERFGSTIDTFNRDLDALAPPGAQRNKTRQIDHERSSPARRQHADPHRVEDRPRPGPRPSSSRPSGR